MLKCICSTCCRPIPMPAPTPPRSSLVSMLYSLSNEFNAMAEDQSRDRSMSALGTADALVMLARKAEAHGDDSVIDDIEAVMDGRDIKDLMVVVESRHA